MTRFAKVLLRALTSLHGVNNMAKIRFISVGDFKENYLKEAFSEYKKRLRQYAEIEEIIIPEARIHNEDSPSEIATALRAEGEKIIASLPKDSYTFALCVEGKQLDSPELANEISRAVNGSGKINFIIGSSHGLSAEVKNAANFKLSFSRLTFPHQLMKVILAEATYRSFTIMAGKKYHK